MLHMGKFLATVATALVCASPASAVTLVTPQGAPVGGTWQTWANESRVPTVSGTLTFVPSNSACSGAPSCRQGGAPYQPAGTPFTVWVLAPDSTRGSQYVARDSLYFELSGAFDARYLTDVDRRYLARGWGEPRAPWWNTVAALEHNTENGLEVGFASVYADCAEGINDNGGETGFFNAGPYHAPTLYPTINTCVYLQRIARRVHADIAASRRAPWNRVRLRG